MALERSNDDAYAEAFLGVRFGMRDDANPVPCLVTTEALDVLTCASTSQTQIGKFLEFREKIEAIAAEKFAAGQIETHGDAKIIVYSHELNRRQFR